ncbi:hypothetical protein [Endozoicomonas sp. ALB115]|uniref:hypothetical protein n=1 Tax=Endozoicomonas sp. ALB115 TaxID=3403074 RepID=UPI003BB6CC2D
MTHSEFLIASLAMFEALAEQNISDERSSMINHNIELLQENKELRNELEQVKEQLASRSRLLDEFNEVTPKLINKYRELKENNEVLKNQLIHNDMEEL